MKVVGIDNLGRDYNGGRDEILAGENLTEAEAKALCKEKNINAHRDGPWTYYVVKPDDYVLYIFEGY